MKTIFNQIIKNPSIIFYIIVGFVVISFVLFLLIDVFNIFGVKNILLEKLRIAYFWYHWYDMPFEIPLQWYVLGTVLLVYAINAGRAFERNDKNVVTIQQCKENDELLTILD